MKLDVQLEVVNSKIEHEPCGDGLTIRLEMDYRVSVARLPDDHRGPCVVVLACQPGLMFVGVQP